LIGVVVWYESAPSVWAPAAGAKEARVTKMVRIEMLRRTLPINDTSTKR
jgi:hypothetical protein